VSRTAARLSAITVKGGLWGADLLAALAAEPDSLPKATVSAESYGMPRRGDIKHIARAAWSILQPAWEEFSERHAEKVDTEGERYGSDDFTWKAWTTHLLDVLGFAPEQVVGGLVANTGHPEDPTDTYPITHLHHDQVPVHAVPAGAPLDRRSKGVHGAAGQSPHSLVQDYLNRTDDHLWAVITNGLALRVVRDNAAMARQAYIEFDLPAIFDTESYSDFELLWRAGHATRFTHPADGLPTDCIAEAWQAHATKTGVAALEDLQEGVEKAIAELGQALIEHHANTALRDALDATDGPDADFDATALFQELLYVAYQHVFWFTLDDRDLLFPADADPDKKALYRDHYGSAQLRDRARRHLGGNHPDAWHAYRLLAGWFADPDGQPALEIPPLLGDLWSASATPHLAGTTVTNRRYYEALRRLGYVLRDGVLNRINYDAMSSEELGAVYEALLEIIPTVDTQTRSFTLGRTSGSDRKKTGSYYTPTSLIERVLDDALDPVVDDRLAAVGNDRTAREQAILAITVCDPAMGSAHFLVGAGMRLAKHLATVRTGEPEPAPEAVQKAFRDVAARCLYGVDVNPPAVTLAKVAIWLECHVPGQPLTFLDHHLKHGNALLGVGFDPDLIDWQTSHASGKKWGSGGVPDAAFTALHGDLNSAATTLKKDNQKRRAGHASLLASGGSASVDISDLAKQAVGIAWLDDSTPAGLAAKRDAWMVYGDSENLLRERLLADAWMACWTMPKNASTVKADDQPFDVFYDSHYHGLPDPDRAGVRAIAEQRYVHSFFHWYLEFPDIHEQGGFDCMVGNPPWEVLQMGEEEWFKAAGRPDIAKARTQSARRKKIAALYTSMSQADLDLARRWDIAVQRNQVQRQFASKGGRFPWGGVGKLNLYALFADHFLTSRTTDGAAGFICPDGIAVGATYADFFGHLVISNQLVSFWSFENEEKVFSEVHNETKFALVTLRAHDGTKPIGFTGYIRQAAAIDDPERRYDLTADQIAAINPNTLTAPLFRQAGSADVTASIHSTVGVLINETKPEDDPAHDPWDVDFLQMFNMASDSSLFRDDTWIAERGGTIADGRATLPNGGRLVPLYEGKMCWQYDHRYGTYDGQTEKQANKGVLPHTTDAMKADPDFTVTPRHWVEEKHVNDQLDGRWSRDWLVGWRDVGPSERTLVPAVIPRTATGDVWPLLLPGKPTHAALLVASLSSLAADYAARQKTGGRMKQFTMRQVPILAPDVATTAPGVLTGETVAAFVAPRVAELTHTSWEMQGWAADIGYGGNPFRWDADRRPILQAELDALMLHLYGLNRDGAEWVVDSFAVLKKYETRPRERGGYGEFRTKRLVLQAYDALAKAGDTGQPFTSTLAIPPADDSLRH
jgi:hypothetical protein